MNFDKFNRIQAEKLNLREMPEATAVGVYRNAGCGDLYRVFLKVNDAGVIEDATFTTTGCGFGIAALALCCEVAKGRDVDAAERITTAEIEAGVDGFPPRRQNYPQSALDALQIAIRAFRSGEKEAAGLTSEEVGRRLAAGESLARLGAQGAQLPGIDLAGRDLSGGNWSGSDFAGANLSGANLSTCILRSIKGTGTCFAKADLRHADLYLASLVGADFSEADLRHAFLNDANLERAVLRDADLRNCRFTASRIQDADFSGARYDRTTRFDPGIVWPFAKMILEGSSAPFLKPA